MLSFEATCLSPVPGFGIVGFHALSEFLSGAVEPFSCASRPSFTSAVPPAAALFANVESMDVVDEDCANATEPQKLVNENRAMKHSNLQNLCLNGLRF